MSAGLVADCRRLIGRARRFECVRGANENNQRAAGLEQLAA